MNTTECVNNVCSVISKNKIMVIIIITICIIISALIYYYFIRSNSKPSPPPEESFNQTKELKDNYNELNIKFNKITEFIENQDKKFNQAYVSLQNQLTNFQENLKQKIEPTKPPIQQPQLQQQQLQQQQVLQQQQQALQRQQQESIDINIDDVPDNIDFDEEYACNLDDNE